MSALPQLQFALSNCWLLLVAYAVGFLLALAPFSNDDKARLFADHRFHLRGMRRLVRHVGQFIAVAFIVLMVFAPITHSRGLLALGLTLYALGYSSMIIALPYFRLAKQAQPVTEGPYRLSRNPQWVGSFLVLLGTATLSDAWLPIALVLIVGSSYHLQILEEERACAAQYGAPYEAYLRRVPRYFLRF